MLSASLRSNVIVSPHQLFGALIPLEPTKIALVCSLPSARINGTAFSAHFFAEG